MSLSLNSNGPTQNGYVAVTIRDQQNGHSKTYKFPEGTTFNTTTTRYYLSNNGIQVSDMTHDENYNEKYSKKRPYNSNTIDVTLPQYIALDVFDINNDNKLDYYDVDNVERYGQYDDGGAWVEETAAGFEINDRLSRTKSQYRTYGFMSNGADTTREGHFYAEFCNINERFPDSIDADHKKISIFLPNR